MSESEAHQELVRTGQARYRHCFVWRSRMLCWVNGMPSPLYVSINLN